MLLSTSQLPNTYSRKGYLLIQREFAQFMTEKKKTGAAMHFSGMTELKFGKKMPHIVTYLKAF